MRSVDPEQTLPRARLSSVNGYARRIKLHVRNIVDVAGDVSPLSRARQNAKLRWNLRKPLPFVLRLSEEHWKEPPRTRTWLRLYSTFWRTRRSSKATRRLFFYQEATN
jgi:hypothetical protein